MSETEPAEPFAITTTVCNVIVDVLIDFVDNNQIRMMDGLISQDATQVEEARLMLQDLAGAMAWPSLILVFSRLKTSGLQERFSKLVALANQQAAPGIQAHEPLPALASLVEMRCREGIAVIEAHSWTGNSHIHRTLTAATIILRLGGATPALQTLLRRLQEVVHSMPAPLKPGDFQRSSGGLFEQI